MSLRYAMSFALSMPPCLLRYFAICYFITIAFAIDDLRYAATLPLLLYAMLLLLLFRYLLMIMLRHAERAPYAAADYFRRRSAMLRCAQAR